MIKLRMGDLTDNDEQAESDLFYAQIILYDRFFAGKYPFGESINVAKYGGWSLIIERFYNMVKCKICGKYHPTKE